MHGIVVCGTCRSGEEVCFKASKLGGPHVSQCDVEIQSASCAGQAENRLPVPSQAPDPVLYTVSIYVSMCRHV